MPSYSAYAEGISKGQIIAIGKAGGAMIKTAGGKIMKLPPIVRGGGGAVLAWCMFDKKCRDKMGDAVELACEAVDICTANHKDDDTGDDDDGFVCDGRVGYKWATAPFGTRSDVRYSGSYLAYAQSFADDIVNMQENRFSKSIQPDFKTIGKNGHRMHFSYEHISDNYHNVVNAYGTVLKICNTDKRLSNDELNDLAKKISERMDNDDIINYYNNDYGDITINNQRYDGDEINQQTNIDNKCQNNSCNELSKEVENAVRKGKIDIDDVNDKNCTLEKNTGKYIACNIDIDKDSDDSDTTNNTDKDDDDTTNNTNKDDDEIKCDSSEFHKKVCDWIDWTQKDLDEQEDGKVEIKDLSKDLELDDDKINFGRACPSGPTVDISFAGARVYHQISYDGLCVSYEDMRPFVIGIGGIVSVMIIGGRRV